MRHSRPFFDLLDPLRGFAAITVLIYHVIEITNWSDFPAWLGWFKRGWMGVDIFFVLSGFVISLSALQILEKHKAFGPAAKEYAQRRLRRIVPLHYLTILLYIVLFSDIFGTADFWQNLGTHLLFIHNWFPDYHRSLNAPNWTSAVEVQFYVVIILVIPLVKPANLKYFIIGSFALAFLWRSFSFYSTPVNADNFLDSVFVKATQLPGMIDYFGCGLFLAFIARSPFFAKLRKKWWFRIVLIAGILILAQIAFGIINTHEKTWWLEAITVVFPRSLLALLFSLVILLLCTFPVSPFFRFLLWPLFYLGVISYGIYLFHWPVLLYVRRFELSPLYTLSLTLFITLCVSALSWHYYEKRFLAKSPDIRNK